MTLIDAAKQAREAWQTSVYGSERHHKAMLFAMTKIGQAIEQAEKQEPVGVVHHKAASVFGADFEQVVAFTRALAPGTKLYTTPPAAQRQPLTDEQVDDIWNRYCDEMGEASINDAYDIARAIEAAHGITGEKK